MATRVTKEQWIVTRDAKVGKRPIKGYDLIICCGEQTEPNYFGEATNWFIKEAKIKKDVAQFFIIRSHIVDPLNMARMAKEIKQDTEQRNGVEIDHVWVVFDKDNFENDAFNNAVKLLDSEKNYTALWSNQCFELWLLLHFSFMNSAIDRNEYYKKLSEFLKERYAKNSKTVFNQVMSKGNLQGAIRNAIKLHDKNKTPANNEPATTVYEFFLFYSRYLGVNES